MENRIYMCIDLKSFYASVECQERGLDPLTTNLVVADKDRTEKTICLAISPSLKQYGMGGRARLFEVVQKVKEINAFRKIKADKHIFTGKSFEDTELKANKNLELDYIVAKPRMAFYMMYSTQIYQIYLKYIAPEDIFVYSIDEVFCDITNYLKPSGKTPKEFATMVIKDVYDTTGITATAGLGTNLYLAKIAMDIVAKHAKPNEFGVRIAALNEERYRRILWEHRPLTDFWRVGKGYRKKLEAHGLYTMGDVARCSLNNEELLYKMFGVNAELLIDHAWGYENATMQSVKNYKPTENSLSSGQVLHCPYNYNQTKLIVREMVDELTFNLVAKKLVTNQIVLTIGYDIENLSNQNISSNYKGEVTTDFYGRSIPKHAHGTINIDHYTSSSKTIAEEALKLYDRIINKDLLVRRIYIYATKLIDEDSKQSKNEFKQINFFEDINKQYEELDKKEKQEQNERKLQKAMLNIKYKYGKNAVIKAMDLQEDATGLDRNKQVGGHSE